MKNTKALQAMKESILTIGEYQPSQTFLSYSSVAIEFNGQPLILLGAEDDIETNEVAEKLLNSKIFFDLVSFVFNEPVMKGSLKKTIVKNKDFNNYKYLAIVESEQGLVEEGNGNGLLVAILPNENLKGLAFFITVNNELMRIFYPQAKPIIEEIKISEIPFYH